MDPLQHCLQLVYGVVAVGVDRGLPPGHRSHD